MPTSSAHRAPSDSLYVWLSRRGWPGSYAGKFLLIVCVGACIPLAAAVAYFAGAASPSATYTGRAIAIVAAATCAALVVLVPAIRRLLSPVLATQQALRQYRTEREIPYLPTGFADEAGVLMADLQQTLGELERSTRRLELFDVVTGLPNAALFVESVSQTRATVRRSRAAIAVVAIDVFGIDDAVAALGPSARDVLLRGVTSRLASSVREGDVVARVGESTFAVMGIMAPSAPITASSPATPDTLLANALLAQANRLIGAITRPLPAPDASGTQCVVQLGAAAGVATFPADATEPDALLAQAQSAAREAVAQARRDRQPVVTGFSPEMRAALQERVAIERDLREAIERQELGVVFQPRVDLESGFVSSAEALVRWDHPERGVVFPADFLHVAEASGLIVPIGAIVLEQACRQAQRWAQSGRAIRVAVNFSAQQIARGDVVALVRRVLAETALPASLLEIEVGEGVVTVDPARAALVLGELRSLGVAVTLDDFGAGVSSLGTLRAAPFSAVKIARSVVRGVIDDAACAAMADAVIAAARGLSLPVTAVGVETEAQTTYFRERACTAAQGFYFAQPMRAEALSERLAPAEAAA
jgi:diguanylate cyclase (GGDEF)-like protein